MSIAYIGDDGLFTAVGKLIEKSNKFRNDIAAAMPADLLEIQNVFETQDVTTPVADLPRAFSQILDSLSSAQQYFASAAELRLTDRATVIDELGLPSVSTNTAIAALIDRMNADSESVNASVASVPWPALTTTSNSPTGVVIVSKMMDGMTPVLASGSAHPAYAGLDSQMQISETQRIECVRDAGDGATAGYEQFQISGGVPDAPWGILSEGSGTGITISTANASGLVSGGDFESFSSDTPSGWTIASGDATTNVAQETGNVFLGSSCMKIIGDGATAAVTLTQSKTSLRARVRHLVGVALKRATSLSAGTFSMMFSGTGYTPTGTTTQVQRITISGTPTGGTYSVGFRDGSADVAYDASSATLQTALRTIRGLEGVTVSTHSGAAPNIAHNVTMQGVDDPESMTVSVTSLTGGTPAGTVTTPTPWVRGEKLTIPYTGIPTEWGIRWFFVTMPDVIPSDFQLEISFSGTPANGEAIYVDNIVIDTLHWHNGLAWNVIAGDEPFKRGDRYETTIVNTEGVIQKWFREWRGIQLPSDAAGGETIPDSLAQ